MIKAIFQSILDRAKQEHLTVLEQKRLEAEALLEAAKAEDDDIVVLPQQKQDKLVCPTCLDHQELRDYIRQFNFIRIPKKLFIHCTATAQNARPESILRYWRETKKWSNPGYHILVTARDGFTVMADFNTVANGVARHNSDSVHISYIGGINQSGKAFDNRTAEQSRIIEIFIEEMVTRFPSIKVVGHNEASNKACPSFRVRDEYKNYWTGL